MTVTMILGNAELDYLNKIVIKSLTTTINKLIKYFWDNGLPVTTSGRRFEDTVKFGVSIHTENIKYIESIKVVSKSFTLACLIATAREMQITVC